MACDDIYREQMERNIRAAQQLDRADNPCFGGLFPDRRPSIQTPAERMEALKALRESKWTDPPVDVETVRLKAANEKIAKLEESAKRAEKRGMRNSLNSILDLQDKWASQRPRPKMISPAPQNWKALWRRLVAHWTWIWCV